jgi:hypothetical protein
VAQGFLRREGIDFTNTFAPVATMTSVPIIFAVAAAEGLVVEQTDVDKAYLHGDLEEDIYMKVPEGMRTGHDGNALKLKKALYGLKQAGCAWNTHFRASLLATGYKQCISDPCMFYRLDSSGPREYLLAYVDNLLHAATSSNVIAKTKKCDEPPRSSETD